MDARKAELLSLVVPCVRGRTESLVEPGLDLCRGVLVLRGFLNREEVIIECLIFFLLLQLDLSSVCVCVCADCGAGWAHEAAGTLWQ